MLQLFPMKLMNPCIKSLKSQKCFCFLWAVSRKCSDPNNKCGNTTTCILSKWWVQVCRCRYVSLRTHLFKFKCILYYIKKTLLFCEQIRFRGLLWINSLIAQNWSVSMSDFITKTLTSFRSMLLLQGIRNKYWFKTLMWLKKSNITAIHEALWVLKMLF